MATATKIWHLVPHDQTAIEHLARALNLSPIVAQLLLNRGQREPELCRRFLDAPLTGLYEPERLPGVNQAAERLLSAVQAQRRICVYGDYDVDGVTGTAILLTCLRLLGAQVEFHVPHRLHEGYGLNSETLRRLAQTGVAVVVTVDCGIASLAEADEARRLGLELIITDHHEPRATLPAADAVVHPRLANGHGPYPFENLSGSGVAFKLAWAVCKRFCNSDKVTPQLREFLLDAVALAALGTVADVVPLHDENRIFVRHGLARLRRNPTLGLQALLKQSGLDAKAQFAAMDIGYNLAPRINAAGRLGTARLAVELLTTPSADRAVDLARFLEEQNQQRQLLERRILHEARDLVDAQHADDPALVLVNSGWHPGLIGIVASRLVDLYGRPVLMIAVREGQTVGQGSGRSIPGFKLHEALQECTGDLLGHGGHAAAAGFRIDAAAIDLFRTRFCTIAKRQFGEGPPAPRLVIDAEVPLAALTPGLVQALQQLEPYGAGNPEPLFLAGPLQVVGQPKRVGGGDRHLSFRVRQGNRDFKAIAFGQGDRAEELMSAAGHLCLVFRPRINEWQGFRSVDLEVRDWQPGRHACLG
jgi:single-stranded-DNA-specific exonuclease